MRIDVIALANKMPNWVNEGVQSYLKRIPKQWAISFIDIPLLKRQKNSSLSRILDKEAQLIRNAIVKGNHVVSLEIFGQMHSSPQLASRINTLQMQGKNVSILIGGPEGLLPSLSESAHESWSLSTLTLPHPLVRIVLSEAIYRAWSIATNHPYHK